VSFAFSDDFKWNKKSIKQSWFVTHAAAIDFEQVVPSMYKDTAAQVTKILLAAAFALTFCCLVICDAVHYTSRRITMIQNSKEFREEVRDCRTGLGTKPAGPTHQVITRLMLFQWVIDKVFKLGSTFLFVPLCTYMVEVLDCEEGCLQSAPGVKCFGDLHILLLVCICTIAPAFVWIALPYSIVEGESLFVARRDVARIRQWRNNAAQLCGLLWLGPMQEAPGNAFYARVFQTLTKAACPCLHVLLTKRPRTQAICMIAIHTLGILQSAVFPAFFFRSMRLWNLGFRAITLLGFIAALAAELIQDASSEIPGALWHGGLTLLLLSFGIGIRYCWIQESQQHDKPMHSSSRCDKRALMLDR